MNLDFKNKVVIVTGASSGLGAETARLFAEYNARLTIIGRDKPRLTAVAAECEQLNGLKPLSLLLDLTHQGSCEEVINKTVATFGKIDVLVNCAGQLLAASIYDQSMEVFDAIMSINFRVPYHLTQLAMPHLKRTKGNVININSSLTKRYKPGFLPYVVSKCALEKFTQHAAPEIAADGIRINCISPGTIRTNILNNLNLQQHNIDQVFKELARDMPTGVLLEAKEVATLICLTASENFPSMTGAHLVIDDGACIT